MGRIKNKVVHFREMRTEGPSVTVVVVCGLKLAFTFVVHVANFFAEIGKAAFPYAIVQSWCLRSMPSNSAH